MKISRKNQVFYSQRPVKTVGSVYIHSVQYTQCLQRKCKRLHNASYGLGTMNDYYIKKNPIITGIFIEDFQLSTQRHCCHLANLRPPPPDIYSVPSPNLHD